MYVKVKIIHNMTIELVPLAYEYVYMRRNNGISCKTVEKILLPGVDHSWTSCIYSR